jgi:2-polyprenyl-3-methyl-5-hydroxy-6-metoxy-1,4-benzoquinol methylase
VDETAHSWDEIHARRNPHAAHDPHPYLREAVGGLVPGHALDLGCGDGSSAIWLAANGWTVTGVDLSQVALDRAAARAVREGVDSRVRWERADLREWRPTRLFDLAVEIFVHTESDVDRSSVRARVAESVAPAGSLLVVAHRTLAPWVPNPTAHDLPSAREIVRDLALVSPGWDVLRADEVPREVERDGVEATVLDAIVHAVRRG